MVEFEKHSNVFRLNDLKLSMRINNLNLEK